MKARNREINIFNMSLLDILCGALGAFCFMMLVLFPYYKPKAQMSDVPGVDPKTYEEALKQIRDLKALLQSCRSDQDSCKSDLKQSNEQLGMKNPMAVIATFTGPNDLDVYIEDDRVTVKGVRCPKADPNVKQGPTFTGDARFDATTGIASDIWLVRDAPAREFRVYLKLMKQTADRQPTQARTYILLSLDQPVELPVVELKRQGEMIRVATITAKADGHASVRIDLPKK
jgi:hypothetical protein